MTTRQKIITLFVLAAIAAGIVLVGRAGRAADSTSTSMPPAAAAPAAPVELNKSGSAKWTATTQEAAASDANKKVLAAAKPMTVSGEIVDVSCYLQLGKRGEAHVACGSKCIAHGEPIGLVDGKGTLYLLFAEEHHPRRDGQVDIRKVFAPLLAKQVTLTGMVSDMRGVKGLYVSAAEIGAQAAPAEEKKE